MEHLATSIPTPQTSSNIAQTNIEEAQLLNIFFQSCFNKACAPLNNEDFCPFHVLIVFLKICFPMKTKSVTCFLSGCIKILCPDDILSRMLKATAASIAPSVASLFNLSLKLGRVPLKWKEQRYQLPTPKVISVQFLY